MSLKESHYLLNYQINSVVYVYYDEISLVLPSYSLCSISCNSYHAFADIRVTLLSRSLPTPVSNLCSLMVFCFVCFMLLLSSWNQLVCSLFSFQLHVCRYVWIQPKVQKLEIKVCCYGGWQEQVIIASITFRFL